MDITAAGRPTEELTRSASCACFSSSSCFSRSICKSRSSSLCLVCDSDCVGRFLEPRFCGPLPILSPFSPRADGAALPIDSLLEGALTAEQG